MIPSDKNRGAHRSSSDRAAGLRPQPPAESSLSSIPCAEAFHPSEYIKDELEVRQWSVPELAHRMGGGDVRLNLLALDLYFEVGPSDSNCRIGDKMACQLAVAFDVSCQFFKNLEASWLAHASGTEARQRQDREDGPGPKGDGPTAEGGDAQ